MRSEASKTKMKFKVVDLLSKLKENRANHDREHKETSARYFEKLTGRLNWALVQAKEGRPIDVYKSLNLPYPSSHVKSYDTVIAMLEMTSASEVEISAAEFQEYVLDDWEWSQNFKSVSSSYLED